MKKYDRIAFRHGFEIKSGTVLGITSTRLRVRFFPWSFSGLWVSRSEWREIEVTGRSFMGKFVDWCNK